MTPPIPVIGPVTVPFATFLAAFLVACITESIKLHDKISDLFRIRSEFDIRWILIPMALISGTTLTLTQIEKLRFSRQRLMGLTFYAYASSTKPVIDPHTITQALTTWSWYWLCIEASVALLVTSVILAYVGQSTWVAGLTGAVLFLLGLARLFHFDCAKYADSQVEQILSDNVRRAAVAAAFNAL